ncbi:MAG: TPM domain-containing protein [Bacteroidota bacterium]|jgi:uncharacterized protein
MRYLSINKYLIKNSVFPKAVGLIFILFFYSSFIFSQDYPKIPDAPSKEKLVNIIGTKPEVENFLTAKEVTNLEFQLDTFSRSTSNQICVVIVDTLNGLDAAQYATQLGLKWGIGLKEKNNGVVLLLCPPTREVFIAPGNRMQGVLPDLRAKQIIEKIIIPRLKKGENYKAISEACGVMMQLARGEVNEVDKRLSKSPKSYGKIILIIVLVVLLFTVFGKFGGGTTIGRGGSYRHGGFGGFGGFSGGRSGGFGGFGGFGGGGGFNGGGAGGRW